MLNTMDCQIYKKQILAYFDEIDLDRESNNKFYLEKLYFKEKYYEQEP